MTLEQLITCYMRKSSKIVVTKITPSTKERIFFSGYERNICNEVTSEFMEFLEKYKKYHVLNYRTMIDQIGIPYTDVLVLA